MWRKLTLTVEGKSATATVTVSDFTLSLQPSSVELAVGGTRQLSAAGFPTDYTGNKAGGWASGNAQVATVDAIGSVTANGVGNCTITFTHTLTGKTATAAVTVAQEPEEVTDQTAPSITGLSTITLPAGYSAHTQSYLITGNPMPDVSVESAFGARINGNGALTILLGLKPGEYQLTLRAKNSVDTASRSVTVIITEAPAITGPSDIALSAGYKTYTQKYTTVGYPLSVLSVSSIPGLSIAQDGTLTIPEGLGKGSYTFTIKAENSVKAAILEVTITVSDLPTINGPDTIKLTFGYAGHSQKYTLGNSPTAVTLGSNSINAGLTEDGTLKIPAGLAVGTYSVTINAENLIGKSHKNVSVIVSAPEITLGPSVYTDPLLDAAYSLQLTALGGTTPYRFAIASGALPSGLTLTQDGLITGTATVSGTYVVAVKATDANDFSGTKQFIFTVPSPPAPPAPTPSPSLHITTSTINAKVNESINSLSAYLQAANGTAPYSFSIQTPPELTRLQCDGSGFLSGMLTRAGTFQFTATVTDANNKTSSKTIKIIVASDLSISTLTITSPATLNATYSEQISSSGGYGTHVFSLLGGSGNLPQGMTLSSTGLLSGMPTESGTFTFTAIVTDDDGYTASMQYTLVVNP